MKLSYMKYQLVYRPFLLVGLLATAPVHVGAQGSVFGEVHNSDLSTPPDNSVLFIGFIDDTDNELRTQSCVGAGYESGHWYDDFQNYIGETQGLEYRYYFFNPLNAEAALLASVIPDNSYEQQDITLAPANCPTPAEGITATALAGEQVQLDWAAEPGRTYHIYRRAASSGGSFFRVDNPAGDRTDPGVGGATYVDTDVVTGECYQYILVTESTSGDYSPASEIIDVDLTSCCHGKVGDVNGIGGDDPTIGDVSLLIDHLFISGIALECIEEADINQSGGANPILDDLSIGDVSLLIDHLFINFVEIPDCL